MSTIDENTFEDIIVEKWDQICRICFTDETVSQSIKDYNQQYEMSFYDMISTSTGLKISPDDNYPNLICSACIRQLVDTVEFIIKCQSSERILTKLFVRRKEYDINKEETYDIVKIETDLENNDVGNSTDLSLCEEDSISSVDKYNYLEDVPNEENNSENVHTSHKTDDIEISELETPKKEPINADSKDQGKNVTCPICETKYTSYWQFIKHKRTSLHKYTCWTCKINLKNEEDLLEHCENHTKCPICEKKFNKREHLKAHMARHSKDQEYLCMVCGKNYSSKSSLDAHLRIHSGEKRYKCDHCDRTFIHWSVMKGHVRTHTNEKPFECSICKKRFSVRSGLTKHKYVHSEERPFACSLCDATFKRSYSLRQHMYNHTGERIIKCELCDKGFSKNYNLKLHMATHTGEKNHVCEICQKAFAHAHVLRGHMKTHRDRPQLQN